MHEERIAFDEKLRHSKLVMQIGRSDSQDSIIFQSFESPMGEYGAIYRQRYNLIINNIGYQDASVTEWRVLSRSIEKHPETHEHLIGWFSGMKPRIYNMRGDIAEFPIKIEPNSPIKLVLEVGVRVPAFAWNSVISELSFNTQYNYYEVEDIFRKKGHPQFGQLQLNRVSRGSELSMIAYGEGVYKQVYYLGLTKGDCREVMGTLTHNISDSFIQGENGGTSWHEVETE